MTEKMRRLLPTKDFPPYAFLPGKHPHPEKEGGHSYGLEIKIADKVLERPFFSDEFFYAVDLFHYGYHWESHVWWEALWHKLGRKGEQADFLKALIKLAAAMVKLRLDSLPAATGHLKRAQELFEPLAEIDSPLDLERIKKELGPLTQETNSHQALSLTLFESSNT